MTSIITINEINRVHMSQFLVALNAFYFICGFIICRFALKITPIILEFNKAYDQYLTLILIFCGVSLIVSGLVCMYFFLCAGLISQRIKKSNSYFYVRIYMVLQSIFICVCIGLMPRERNNLKAFLRYGILESMNQYKTNLEKKIAIDSIQMGYSCCGSDKYSDWFQIPWISNEFVADLEERSRSGHYSADDVPFSCCDPNSPRPCINKKVHSNNLHPAYDFNVDLTLHTIGCKEAIERYMDAKCFWPFVMSMTLLLILYQLNFVLACFLDTSIQLAIKSGDPKRATPAFCSECCSKTMASSTAIAANCVPQSTRTDSCNPFYSTNAKCRNQSASTFDHNASNSSVADTCLDNFEASVDAKLASIKNSDFSKNTEEKVSLKGSVKSDFAGRCRDESAIVGCDFDQNSSCELKKSSMTNIQTQASRMIEKIYPYQLTAAFARTHLESLSSLDIDSQPYPFRLTNIICTIGPASQNVDMLEKMFETGCGIVRLNFSHGSYEYHQQTIENARAAAAKHWLPICIALDTKGPEIRTGVVKGGVHESVELTAGSMVTLTIDDAFKEACDEKNIYVDYKNIVNVLNVGRQVLIDDGAISLIVREKGAQFLKCEVDYGSTLSSFKGVNLPGTDVDLPPITEKDVQDLLFGVDQGIDAVFASFIRNGDGVRSIRQILGEKGKKIKIFSKIECREACKRFSEILEASDGIMVARGDLGVEIPMEKVFLVQKMITARSLRAGKPVICATQMLESMTVNARPTRAELSDVANAVLDCVDCIMLSGESAKGSWPLNCIDIMSKVSKEAESAMYHRQLFEELRMLTPKPADVSRATAMSAVEASIESMAAIIVVLTVSGRSASNVSSYRPRCPILAVTRDEQTARQLRLLRGIVPLWFKGPKANPFEKDVEARIQHALKVAEQKNLININNFVVIVHSSKPNSNSTDSVRIIQYARK